MGLLSVQLSGCSSAVCPTSSCSVFSCIKLGRHLSYAAEMRVAVAGTWSQHVCRVLPGHLKRPEEAGCDEVAYWDLVTGDLKPEAHKAVGE